MFYLEAGIPDKEDEMKRMTYRSEMGGRGKNQYIFLRKTGMFVGLIIFFLF